MKLNKHAVGLVFATLLLVTNANAGEPCRKFLGCPVPDCIGKWCCDDYKSKCLPCVKVPLCFACDDYCRKPMPRVCAPLCFTCDDYCKKCQPPVCRPPLLSTLRCVSDRPSCGCTTCSSGRCDQGFVAGKRRVVTRVADARVASRTTPEVPAADLAESRDDSDGQSTRRPVIIEIFKR